MTNMQIRPQRRPDDLAPIEAMVARAFAEHGGTDAFREFRATRNDVISLVAEADGRIIGNVLFSPVELLSPTGSVQGLGLGQLSVDPAYQNRGVGTALGEAGIAALRERRCPFSIVIGHAAYYPRFGYERGDVHGIECQWDGIPPETFMVLFPCGKQPGLTGKAVFHGL
ncbi:MAG: N-acetyltransferase [Gammaproteobacteria bacterium]|nr:N-acetyltransferase [Gammaproteobacteria bacterium]